MPSPSHHFAVVAAASSAAAGAIHAAASGSHADLATLSSLFALAAVAQIGWAMVTVVRPEPAVLAAGVGIQVGAFGAWLASRTAGIDAIEGLQGGEPVGLQDGMAAGLAGAAALTAVAALRDVRLPRAVMAAVPAVLALVALAVVPAMATPHDHEDHGDHGDRELAAIGTAVGTDDHAHDDSHGHGGADHHDAGAEPATEEAELTEDQLGYPPSFVAFLDQAPDAAARARAEELIIGTHEAMGAFPDEAAVQAAGFISIGDGATGWEHYIHVGRIVDPRVLDPADVESIVMEVHPDGTKEVASAMYLLPFGTTVQDVPDIAGSLTEWHDHQDLCWDGAQVVGRVDADGTCARGSFRATQPMLHVWMQDHPCGPFAGIEGSHGSGCGDHGH